MNHVASKKGSGVLFPGNREQFEAIWPAFKKWLEAKGSQIFAPLTRYEVARFSTPDGVGIVTVNASGLIRHNQWQGGSATAFTAWKKKDGEWRVGERTSNVVPGEKTSVINALIERDGFTCCYCLASLATKKATLEHFFSRTHEGPNHIANMALACEDCNREAGHKCVREKIEFALAQRDLARKRWAKRSDVILISIWRDIADRPQEPCTASPRALVRRLKGWFVAAWRNAASKWAKFVEESCFVAPTWMRWP